MIERVTPVQFRASKGVEEWRLMGGGANAFFRTASLAESARFVQSVGELPGIDAHPPDIDIRPDGVTLQLVTFVEGFGGISRQDLEIAQTISEVAANIGLTADPSVLQSLLVIPGWTNIDEITPFWRAALGYVPRPDSPDEDLVDPHGRLTPFWFEQMEEPRADGGGAIHLVVWVPYEHVEERIAAALAAGGRMVRDEFAPKWWTLADAAGNEIDIATT